MALFVCLFVFKIVSDAKDIIEMLHRRKIDKDPSLATLFGSLAKICPDGYVELSVFSKWAKSNLSFSSPLMILQLHLRTNIVGTAFWARQSQRRQKDHAMAKVAFIKQLEKHVMDKKKQFMERKQAEENERKRLIRLGLGKKGDSRDNVIRKQSILLGFFNLKDRESKYRAVDLKQTMPGAPDNKDDVDDDNDRDAAFLHFSSNNNNNDDSPGAAKNSGDAKRQFNRSKHRPSLYNLLTTGSLSNGPKPTVPSQPAAPRKRGRSFYEALTSKAAGKSPPPPAGGRSSTASGKPTPSKASGGKGPSSKRKKSILAAIMGNPKNRSHVEPTDDDDTDST